MDNEERVCKFTREECVSNMQLIWSKIKRCDWVLQNSEEGYKKDQANKALKKFRPIYEKLTRTYEEF